MGWQSASAGFFFDGMELVAAVAPAAGGLDALKEGIGHLFAVRDEVNTSMAALSQLVSQAYRSAVSPPTEVDAYRALLEHHVFDIVNRWSLIADIHTVNRLQAWFYAGFGLGRWQTCLRGAQLALALPSLPPVPSAPIRLARMAQEAARQMETAAGEEDLVRVRPLFLEGAQRADRLSRDLRAALDTLRNHPDLTPDDDFALITDTHRRIELDFLRIS